MNLKTQLQAGLNQLGLSLNAVQIERLLAYQALLQKWNKSYNLTAISDPQQMLSHHLLDSLSITAWIKPQAKVLDVGTGAGLPGFPLAIALPESRWWLLDSNGKKTRFIQQALAVCAINNAVVVKSRAEDYHAIEPFDVIVSRACAPLEVLVQSVAHLVRPGTRLMAMKTGLEREKASKITIQYHRQEYDLQVPGISTPRKLITLRQLV